MPRRYCICAELALIFALIHQGAAAQDPPNSSADYTLKMPVDEVKVTFHVSDLKGDPIQHLKKDDLDLYDNGKLQKRKVAFHEYSDLPIRVGFLLDSSPSMQNRIDQSQAIATELIRDFFRPNSDRAFTMAFGVNSKVTQDWTQNADAVSNGINVANTKEPNEPEGTALFDALYKACKEKFPDEQSALSGNFVLLFTDGDDTSSRVWEGQAVDMCQRARTAIYVFDPEKKARVSPGQALLEDLVAKTGGRVFYESRTLSVHDALATIVSDMRYQYELIYAPPGLKRDGSFHQIKMKCEVERALIQVRSGYYAYAKR
jgi:Ca-activated chloride channel homolog